MVSLPDAKESLKAVETVAAAVVAPPRAGVKVLQPGETHTFAGIEFVWIPPGTFQMGSPESEKDRRGDEGPVHTVRISKGLWLGKYPVTKDEWKVVMGTEPWRGLPYVLDDARSPAVYVSWNNAQEFIKRLNQKGEGPFRLPTEAEWEYACRAGTQTRFYCGDDADYSELRGYAWFSDNAGKAGEAYAHRVGQKKPNAWGLFDMHGNVSEWCEDWYGENYYSQSSDVDPQGPGSGQTRVHRGGSWYDDAHRARSALRSCTVLGWGDHIFGFRVVRDP